MIERASPLWKPVLVAALGWSFVAITGGALTEIGDWYFALRKPPWQPPDWLFGPVWTLIFALATAASVYAWRRARSPHERMLVVGLMAANGILNIVWTLLFFYLHRPDFAVIEVIALALSVVAPMIVFARFAKPAAGLLAPYLVWVLFAGYLNLTIVRLNAPF